MPTPKLIDPTELLAATDIAALLGVTSPAVSNWQNRHPDFPKPIAIVANGNTSLWLRSDIIRWWIDHYPQAVNVLRTHAEAVLRMLDNPEEVS